MRRALVVAALLGFALALSACRATPAAPAADPATPALKQSRLPEGFALPDGQGWGRAAGLRYLEMVRGGAAADQRLPLLVMIHGLGDRPRAEWFEELEVPVRVVMPQAPAPYHGGFAWFDYRVVDQDPVALAGGIGKAAVQLAEALSQLQQARPTQGFPIVAGFSQGGMLSYALALHHPEVVGYAIPVSGMLPRALWPAGKPSGKRFPDIAGFHGDADDIVPIAPARELFHRLRELGYRAELREFAGVRHAISPTMGRVFAQVVTSAVAAAGEQM